MNIRTEKLEIMKLVLGTENPNVLKEIKNIFSKTKPKDFWETLPQLQKDEIFEGINEIENGEIIDYEEFMKNNR